MEVGNNSFRVGNFSFGENFYFLIEFDRIIFSSICKPVINRSQKIKKMQRNDFCHFPFFLKELHLLRVKKSLYIIFYRLDNFPNLRQIWASGLLSFE